MLQDVHKSCLNSETISIDISMLTKSHKNERKCRGEKKQTVVRKLIEENV